MVSKFLAQRDKCGTNQDMVLLFFCPLAIFKERALKVLVTNNKLVYKIENLDKTSTWRERAK